MTLCGDRICNVFRKVNQHGAGTAFGRDEISFGDHAGNIGGIAGNIAMLHNRERNAENINFLEGVRAHQITWDLACYENNRHTIQIGIGNRGHKIGRAGARGGQRCTRASCGAGITNRSHAAALLMTA